MMSIIGLPKISLKKVNKWHFRFSTKQFSLFIAFPALLPLILSNFPSYQYNLQPSSPSLLLSLFLLFFQSACEENKFTKKP